MKKTQTNISRSGAKWLPGAMAVASTAATSHAATVQITFTNSFVSHSDNATNLVTDIGGDGIADLSGFGSLYSRTSSTALFQSSERIARASLRLVPNAGIAYANGFFRSFVNNSPGYTGAGLNQNSFVTVGVNSSPSGFVQAFYFLETVVEGLGSRAGWLEVQASADSGTPASARIDVLRFVFDDASPTAPVEPMVGGAAFTEYEVIPEPSSFALLTLGAAGLLARRRRNQAA